MCVCVAPVSASVTAQGKRRPGPGEAAQDSRCARFVERGSARASASWPWVRIRRPRAGGQQRVWVEGEARGAALPSVALIPGKLAFCSLGDHLRARSRLGKQPTGLSLPLRRDGPGPARRQPPRASVLLIRCPKVRCVGVRCFPPASAATAVAFPALPPGLGWTAGPPHSSPVLFHTAGGQPRTSEWRGRRCLKGPPALVRSSLGSWPAPNQSSRKSVEGFFAKPVTSW